MKNNSSVALLPKVAVVMATYNGEKFLRQQLDSVLQQTYRNIELIAVDDCSTDGTFKLLKQYAARHKNIRVFRNETNIGYIKNFEKAIRLATAEYIALCDQDDIWLPDKISILMDYINNASVVYCNSELIDDKGNSLNKKMTDLKKLDSYDDCLSFLIGNGVFGHAQLMRKSLALEAMPFPEDCPHDWILPFIASFSGTVKFVDKPLVKYRQHAENISGLVKTADRKDVKKTKQEDLHWIRKRMSALAKVASRYDSPVKNVIIELSESYDAFSFRNNLKRMLLFFKYRHSITAFKKRNNFRKWLFCLKMFFKIA
ncbi:MAG TPA: glycosyltransferase family 2 protein [Chitinophagaceae bacterium]|nr:glycosyltransferase family 2 protein [Chitinophagaceae bacterium]